MLRRHATPYPAALLLLAACFTEPPFDSAYGPPDEGSSDDANTPQAIAPGSDDDDTSDAASDDASDSDPTPDADSGSDAPIERCGDGTLDPDEGCDDGNREPGDGCDPWCEPETSGCANTADPIADNHAAGIAVCGDPDQATCEADFAELCAPGWHLCSSREHQARNDGWSVELSGHRALGAIRCRAGGGAGHYSVTTPGADGADNCQVGTSRAECPSAFGCNEGHEYALCCAPIPTCGNGITDAPYEECDDANATNGDGCTEACSLTAGSGPYC